MVNAEPLNESPDDVPLLPKMLIAIRSHRTDHAA